MPDPARQDGVFTFHDAPTVVEEKLFAMFLEHRTRTFQGTFHASPDYARWYVYWRPMTAIRSGDLDGNPGTDVDAAFAPWLDFFPSGTPAHPEYPSGHSTVSGAAAFILTEVFGDNNSFTVTSEVRPGARSFPSFSAATAEIADARVFGCIHWRNSCVRGNALGQLVAEYILEHAMLSGDNEDQQ